MPMTSEDRNTLVSAVAEELEDTIYDGADLELVARAVVDRLETQLRTLGWWSPEVGDAVAQWGIRLGGISDKHLTRDVLTSHQAELADILHR